MLTPVFHPLDRPAQLARQSGNDHLFRVDHELGTKATAHFGRDHPQALFRLAEHQRQRVVKLMGHLGGRPDHQRTGGLFQLRQNAATFHRMTGTPVHPKVLADQHLRLRKLLVDSAVSQGVVLQDVGGEFRSHRRRIRPHRIAAIGHHRQGLVLDLNAAGCVLGHMTAAGHHHRNGLPHKGHLVVYQHKRGGVLGQGG